MNDSVPTKVRKAHSGLVTEIQGALDLAKDEARRSSHAEGISSWSVQQHLEHLSLVLDEELDTFDGGSDGLGHTCK